MAAGLGSHGIEIRAYHGVGIGMGINGFTGIVLPAARGHDRAGVDAKNAHRLRALKMVFIG